MADDFKFFEADLHIHTCLSPCADLEMSPLAISKRVKDLKIDLIAITDHNSSLNIKGVYDLSKEYDFNLFFGMEVTTKEEVHILAYFPTLKNIKFFHEIVDKNIDDTLEKKIYENQVIVNKNDEVIGFCKKNLFSKVNLSIEKVVFYIHNFDGVAIAAHIDRMGFGIVGQIGFIPENLPLNGVECYNINSDIGKNYSKKFAVLSSSDAHKLEEIGKRRTIFKIKKPIFKEFRMALKKEKGREVLIK